jgi:hypothetical protein
MWITVIINSAFGCGGTMIPPHHLEVCIILKKKIRKTMWENTAAMHNILKKKLQSKIFNQLNI